MDFLWELEKKNLAYKFLYLTEIVVKKEKSSLVASVECEWVFCTKTALDDKTSLGTHPYASRTGSNVIYQQHKRLVLPKS